MPEPQPMPYDAFTSSLPAPQHHIELPVLRAAVQATGRKVVVLDDDPTGCQTVHDVPLWMVWDTPALIEALREPGPVFYVVTNTRSLTEAAAAARNRQIVANLAQASMETGVDFAIVSRSDSTLRGYYPAETDTLQAALWQHLERRIDGVLIAPFFAEGGRLTAHNIHWVRQGDQVCPAAQTESAQDPAFGYHHSDLREWVEEKTAGRIPAAAVRTVTLEDIRHGGPDAIAAKLATLHDGQVAVVNAVTYNDMNLFCAGLIRAESQGKQYLYRTAASFVRARAGQGARDLLTGTELLPHGPQPAPGLVLCGSFVPRSTEQLAHTLRQPWAKGIELHANAVIEPTTRDAEVLRVIAAAELALRQNAVPVIYTSRQLVTTDKMASLRAGQLISAALVEVARRVDIRPHWVLAKGGITSFDIATAGFGVQRTVTPGQIAPGVPIWTLGPETRHPGLPYIVFPGNVGQAETVTQVIKMLYDPTVD